MHTDFVVHAKCTIFWLNIGVRVYFAIYPCFLSTWMHNKYLKVIILNSGTYKSKCTLKPLVSQNMVCLLK